MNLTVSGLIKEGEGELELRGVNTFNGVVAINEGVLDVQHPAALGATTGDTLVNEQGTLEITGGLAIPSGEALALDTDGTMDAFRATTGSNSWAGPVVLVGSAARVAVP